MRIYTGTGDDGTTGLFRGGRVSKADPATEAYGTVDEAVAALGVARALSDSPQVQGLVLRLQRELFVLGADLATNPDKRDRLEPGISLVTEGMVRGLESVIDERVAAQPLPDHFVVPGGGPVSAALDLARSIVRRAERRTVEMREAGRVVSDDALTYLNRLSDLLFVLARWQAGGPEEDSRER